MYRKKEILIICFILLVTIFYFISSNYKENNDSYLSSSYVKVKIEGEVKKEITLTIPKGYTYGYVINKTKIYFNEYSYYDCDLYQAIYEDTTLKILSNDYKSDYDSVSSKVSISKGSFDELICVYGIGEKRANKIIDYRKSKKISSYEELQKILGVSDEVIKKIRSQTIL